MMIQLRPEDRLPRLTTWQKDRRRACLPAIYTVKYHYTALSKGPPAPSEHLSKGPSAGLSAPRIDWQFDQMVKSRTATAAAPRDGGRARVGAPMFVRPPQKSCCRKAAAE